VRIEEERAFEHPQATVWDRLMDFDVLARTLPGIEALEPLDDDTCRLTVNVLVPSITGKYQGQVKVERRDPPHSYELCGDAKGRLGWVRGEARFELSDDGDGTRVSAAMDFQTGGVLSGVGQRFMEGMAKSMVRDFFDAFGKEFETAPTP
jgi:carbon monoxide dehydrogenase subunit G